MAVGSSQARRTTSRLALPAASGFNSIGQSSGLPGSTIWLPAARAHAHLAGARGVQR